MFFHLFDKKEIDEEVKMKKKDTAVENKFSKTLQVKEKYKLSRLVIDVMNVFNVECSFKVSDEAHDELSRIFMKFEKSNASELVKLEKENKELKTDLKDMEVAWVNSNINYLNQISTLQKQNDKLSRFETERVRKIKKESEHYRNKELEDRDKVWSKRTDDAARVWLKASLNLQKERDKLKTQNKELESIKKAAADWIVNRDNNIVELEKQISKLQAELKEKHKK